MYTQDTYSRCVLPFEIACFGGLVPVSGSSSRVRQKKLPSHSGKNTGGKPLKWWYDEITGDIIYANPWGPTRDLWIIIKGEKTKSIEEIVKLNSGLIEKLKNDWGNKLFLPEAKEIIKEKHAAILTLLGDMEHYAQK